MEVDFAAWKNELLFTGRIVQDGDRSVAPDEAHRRFLRYVEMLEQLDGSEGTDVLTTIFQSVQMKNDYGAYQTAYGAIGRFPDDQFIRVFIQQLPGLIARQPDWAGEFLVGLANGEGGKWDYQIELFNKSVAMAPPEIRLPIVEYIRAQEDDGWLKHRIDVLCSEL